MSEVARRLGIGRSTLYRKLKELGLEQADEPGEDLQRRFKPSSASACHPPASAQQRAREGDDS